MNKYIPDQTRSAGSSANPPPPSLGLTLAAWPAADTRRAPVQLPVGVVVWRLKGQPVYASCALCWVGPQVLSGVVRARSAIGSPSRFVCGRCLVTLEMLAAQFGPDLRLQFDTPPRPYRSSAEPGCSSA